MNSDVAVFANVTVENILHEWNNDISMIFDLPEINSPNYDVLVYACFLFFS